MMARSDESLTLLLSALDGSEQQHQLDATLVEDNDESDDESDSQLEPSSAPTIELKVALGKLDENPGLDALLAAEVQSSDHGDVKQVANGKKHKNNGDESKAASLKIVSESTSQKETTASSTNKKRKVLIEELS